MRFVHQDAEAGDLPRIVEIYNFAVATRESSCDLEPTTIEARRESFSKHSPGFMPRVARLGDIERDLVMMGRRLA